MQKTAERTSGTILFYMCNGDVKVFPDGKRVGVEDDAIVCFDDQGLEVARFRTREVYMCTSRPVPRALL